MKSDDWNCQVSTHTIGHTKTNEEGTSSNSKWWAIDWWTFTQTKQQKKITNRYLVWREREEKF